MLLEVFLQVLFDSLVGDFYLSITRGMLGRGEHFLYSKLLTKCDKLWIIELFSIICDHDMREPEIYR